MLTLVKHSLLGRPPLFSSKTLLFLHSKSNFTRKYAFVIILTLTMVLRRPAVFKPVIILIYLSFAIHFASLFFFFFFYYKWPCKAAAASYSVLIEVFTTMVSCPDCGNIKWLFRTLLKRTSCGSNNNKNFFSPSPLPIPSWSPYRLFFILLSWHVIKSFSVMYLVSYRLTWIFRIMFLSRSEGNT